MNIAFISSFHKETTTETQGGAQVWAAQFLLEEIKRNNTFDLYAIKNSIDIPGKINLKPVLDLGVGDVLLDPFFANSKTMQRDLDAYSARAAFKMLFEIKAKEDSYDLVIDSSGRPFFGLAWDEFKKPLLTIGHSPVERQYANFYRYFPLPKNVSFAFPTVFQAKACPWIPDSAKYVIPHGIDISSLPFIPKIEENNLVFLGRYDPDTPKGLVESIEVANTLKLPLDIYTYIENEYKSSYDLQIRPKLDENPQIHVFLPPQPPKGERFKKAKAMLFPTQWEEPFGLVMIEAMATGTPVIGFARGSVPEVISDGETGFIVNPSDDDIRGDFIIKKTGIEGLCEAVEKIYSMSEEAYSEMRKKTRERVEKNFTIERMVDQYEEVYKKIIEKAAA